MKKTNKKQPKEISRKELAALINISQHIVNIAKADFNKQMILPYEYETKLRIIIEDVKMCSNKVNVLWRYNMQDLFSLKELELIDNIIEELTMKGNLKNATELYIQLTKTNLFKMDVVKHLKDNKLI